MSWTILRIKRNVGKGFEIPVVFLIAKRENSPKSYWFCRYQCRKENAAKESNLETDIQRAAVTAAERHGKTEWGFQAGSVSDGFWYNDLVSLTEIWKSGGRDS